RIDFTADDGERIIERLHENAPHDIHDADRFAGTRAPEITAASWNAGGRLVRPQQLRLARNVIQHFFLVPDVIAGRHRIDAVAENRFRDVAGDTEPRRRILDVGNDEVERLTLDQRGHRAARDFAPGFAEDVADEEDAHATREQGCGFPCRVAPRCAAW